MKSQERFFIPPPQPTGRRPLEQHHCSIYQTSDGRELLWSGSMPLPEIGSRVFITMNSIGWAVVRGYFESAGYVGVMTKATKPPKWLRAQNRRDAKDMKQPAWYREGVGCEFGVEIALRRPKPKQVAA